MKKKTFSLIALFLGMLLAFPVIGCGGDEGGSENSGDGSGFGEGMFGDDGMLPALPVEPDSLS